MVDCRGNTRMFAPSSAEWGYCAMVACVKHFPSTRSIHLHPIEISESMNQAELEKKALNLTLPSAVHTV